MEFIGVIKEITANEPVVSTRSGQSYDKKSFMVVQEGVQYPNSLGLTLFGDNVAKFNIYVGERVKVNYNARCNSHNGKLFNDLQVWDIEEISQ